MMRNERRNERREARLDPVTTMAARFCVDAGAGSGKTTVLIDRILHLLEQGLADLDEIVAITFTDAAAAEMKVRLRRKFREMAPKDNPAEMTRWRNLERRADTARLSTIHAFCAGLIRENALRAGWDPDFAVLAEPESVLLSGEAIEETLHARLEREHGDGPATRAITALGMTKLSSELDSMLNRRRLMGLILEAGLPETPDALARHWRQLINEAHARRLLTLPNSRRLARYRRRLIEMDGACSKDRDGREVMRRRQIEAIDQIRGAADPGEIEAVLRESLTTKCGSTRCANWGEEAFEQIQLIQKGLKEFLQGYLPPESDPEVEARAAALAADVRSVYESLAATYKRGKVERSSADFDDLIQAAYEMLRDNEEVRARTARGIKFLLIDEFQDTDSWQLQIARLLADHPDGPDLFIVGDAKQSIYDFRGAEVEVFQNEKCAAQTTFLDKNYRTTPDVLAFINETFARSGLLQAVEPEYGPLVPHRAAAGETRVEFLLPPEEEGLRADEYRSREADLIAARLDEMVRGPRPAMVVDRNQQARPAGFGDAALLFRAMSSVYLYEEALRRRGIPYNVVAGRGFYMRQEIIDLRNLLAVLVDPCDEMALLGFLRGPLGGLSDEALMGLCGDGGLLRNFISATEPEGFREGAALSRARDVVARLRARACMPLPGFLRCLLDETGFEAVLLSQFLGVQKAYNVRKAVDLANDFARTRPATLEAFLRYMDQAALDEIREGDAALMPEGAGAVTLMSVHKSKGLEFPIVCVADLSRGQNKDNKHSVYLHRNLGIGVSITDNRGETARPAICEAIKREQADKDDAEQARMLYVAMTRARDWLLLSGSPGGKHKGSWLQAFDELYGVLNAADGDVVRGESPDWSAVVRREAPAHAGGYSRAATIGPEAEEGLWAALSRRAAPVDGAKSARRTFSVHEILDAATRTADPEETPDTDQDSPDVPSRDPMFRGTLVHRMFELWDFSGEAPVDAVMAECPDPALRSRFEPALREIAARFKTSSLAATLSSRTVRREMPFYLNVSGALVHGVIDAVDHDGSLVVDYKTGRPGGPMAQRYELQLRLYAAAIERLQGRAPREAFLYYADHGEVHAVDISVEAVADALQQAAGAVTTLGGRGT